MIKNKGGPDLQKIFIAEDDDNIRDMLLYALKSANFEAEGFADGEALLDAISKSIPSLLLLDIMLPGEDGITILNKLKTSATLKHVPIIMLTAKSAEYDRIKGLDLGADDYITKPFSVLEVISRVKAVLRRYQNTENLDEEHIIGDIILNSGRRTVVVAGEEISLTYKEFELLHYLMINEGIVLSRDKLLEEVWDFDYNGESRTVDMHIKSLRKKLGESGKSIKTVRNVGYKMT